MATTIAIRRSRQTPSAVRRNILITLCGDALPSRQSAIGAHIWIAERYRERLEDAGLATFDDVMANASGRCLRVLPDRENWYLQTGRHTTCAIRCFGRADGSGTMPAAMGMYLKKHRARTWATRIAAACGAGSPPSPGRAEAQNALALQSLGIDVMPLVAYGEKLHADGRLESFLLTEELEGYCELQEFIQRRFPLIDMPSPPAPLPQAGEGRLSPSPPAPFPQAGEGRLSPSGLADPRPAAQAPGLLPAGRALRRLIVQVADIARRFHAAGFNHRDFYCCHFLVKEASPGRFDVRLIDLQRVQQRKWLRRRWIVKDLAQLASMSPDDRVGCRDKILFLRTYLGVRKLRPQDKRLVRDVLWKLSLIRRRARHKP